MLEFVPMPPMSKFIVVVMSMPDVSPATIAAIINEKNKGILINIGREELQPKLLLDLL